MKKMKALKYDNKCSDCEVKLPAGDSAFFEVDEDLTSGKKTWTFWCDRCGRKKLKEAGEAPPLHKILSDAGAGTVSLNDLMKPKSSSNKDRRVNADHVIHGSSVIEGSLEYYKQNAAWR